MIGGSGRNRPWTLAASANLRRAVLAIGLVALTACSQPGGRIEEFEKVMATLGTSPLFAGLESRDQWMVVGRPAADQVTMAQDEGLPVVNLRAGENDIILGRRVNQHLLAIPFLTWAWKMSPHQGLYHPVRLIVGFVDGPMAAKTGRRPITRLPPDARLLELVWNEKALRRGVLDPPGTDGDGPARYTVRGGEEALGKRWTEGVDLIALHDRAWPGLSTRDTRILFVAVRATVHRGKPPPPAALISDIRLIR